MFTLFLVGGLGVGQSRAGAAHALTRGHTRITHAHLHYIYIYIYICTHTYIHTYIHTDGRTDGRTDRQTDIHSSRNHVDRHSRRAAEAGGQNSGGWKCAIVGVTWRGSVSACLAWSVCFCIFWSKTCSNKCRKG